MYLIRIPRRLGLPRLTADQRRAIAIGRSHKRTSIVGVWIMAAPAVKP